MTDILALDLATVTGFARGEIGWQCAGCDSRKTIAEIRKLGGLSCCPERNMQLIKPSFGSVRFGVAGASSNAVFAHALKWAADLLALPPRPDLIILESMLPPTAKFGRTSADVRDRLAGLHGIIRGVAHRRGIYHIAEYSVGAVRGHFLGERSLKREIAKRETVRRCHMLGWQVEDDNAADACALWSMAAGLIEPQHALQLSPLFNKQLRAAE